MRTRVIHLINPKTDSLTTRPIYLNRALYSPLAGLLAVAAAIPRDQYEVVLTDENIEPIDFDLKADMVGVSAMTSYVNRGYEIADQFRAKGVPVVMGGVHPSFMPQEALKHADAVVIGEVELVIDKMLDDLRQGSMKGTYKSNKLHPMVGMKMPRYDLLKKHRYVNKTFVQTSRGCHQGCTFCAEPLMNGLKFRYRPVDEVINEMENCGSRTISINDADFFGTPDRPKEVMRALKGRGFQWQAGVTSKLAQDDRMLELAAESGCTMLSIGFESITRSTLQSVHKHVNRPETFAALVEKVHSYGIMVFGLFMFGFDGDDTSVFDNTVDFNVNAGFDACAFSALTPYPGTLTWYEMSSISRNRWRETNCASVSTGPTGDSIRYRRSPAASRCAANVIARNGRSTMPSCAGRRAPKTSRRSRRQQRSPKPRRCRRSCRSNASGARPCSKPRKDRGRT
jgi:radical SAM superfamily enzyme YgiQ (UPF0313 family)